MAFWEWLAVGSVGVYLHSRVKNIKEDLARENREHEEFMHDQYVKQLEWDRVSNVNSVRQQMPCLFCDGMTRGDFEALALKAAKQTARIKSISVLGARVYATVESQTGMSTWDFNVDFNNWGHIDGTFWTHTENDDSSIPKYYGRTLSALIGEFLRDRSIYLEDFSNTVDENESLETADALDTRYKEHVMDRLLKRGYCTIYMEHPSAYYRGEHLYPVLSLLKKAGFVNIKCIAIEDVDDNSDYYLYEVDNVSIAETTEFERGYAFPHNSKIEIIFHSKRKITMPVSVRKLKKKNYINVESYLQQLGFTEVYERKITDLVLGLVTKNGSVEDVLIDDDGEEQIECGEAYYYDTKIIVTYHTRK